VKTLPKNLIRPLPVQDLEDEGFRRPALLIADAPLRLGRRELKGGSAMKRGESETVMIWRQGEGPDFGGPFTRMSCARALRPGPARRGERARARVALHTLSSHP
jgi:hypothetical protein